MNFLEKGDIIEVVAPSSAGSDPNQLENSVKYYQNLGYVVKYPDDMLDFTHPFHANEDDFRSATLKSALANEDSKIVWCWKGGYGASKLIPDLINSEKPKQEKFFVGFSDITALHIFLNQSWGWKTIHGASFTTPVRDKYSPNNVKLVFEIVQGGRSNINIDDLVDIGSHPHQAPLEGDITGGNLAMIEQSIGTLWQIDMTDKIVILEDVDERGYRIDRMLNHLLQANIIQKAKAIVFGQFTKPASENSDKYINSAIANFAMNSKIPSFKTNLIGHEYTNIPFVYGAKGIIENNNLSMKW